MSDIAELERRITAALERIGRGLDSLPAGTGLGAQDAAVADQRDSLASLMHNSFKLLLVKSPRRQTGPL
mgnify:CR=1 FL=1